MRNYYTVIPAVYLVLEKENKILLHLRSNTGFQDGNYSFVAGHVEADETFLQAVVREAKEEANINIKLEDLHCFHIMHQKRHQERIDIFFSTAKWEGEVKNMEPEKCGGLDWYEKDKLPENVIPYIQQILKYWNEGVLTSAVVTKDGKDVWSQC